MGCDIHAYVESKKPDSKTWWGFGGRINPGRNYRMFGKLAGVRCDGCITKPKCPAMDRRRLQGKAQSR
jgi:hypothetical protein